MKKNDVACIALSIIVSLVQSLVVLAQPDALYNTVGKTYDETRRADREITALLKGYVQAQPGKNYLDVCCGSGNYTIALHNGGITIQGVDLSSVMLDKARAKSSDIPWTQADVTALPFDAQSFDGALCVNAMHHFGDLRAAFRDIARVLKPGSRLVIFTTFKEQCSSSWLNHYFPFIGAVGSTILTDAPTISVLLHEVGFKAVHCEPFFIAPTTQDLYLYAGKYKPEIYLNKVVRDNMSPFNRPELQEAIQVGLIRLEQDITSGHVHDVIRSYEKNIGENVFVIAQK